jgi:hypothetical protein
MQYGRRRGDTFTDTFAPVDAATRAHLDKAGREWLNRAVARARGARVTVNLSPPQDETSKAMNALMRGPLDQRRRIVMPIEELVGDEGS